MPFPIPSNERDEGDGSRANERNHRDRIQSIRYFARRHVLTNRPYLDGRSVDRSIDPFDSKFPFRSVPFRSVRYGIFGRWWHILVVFVRTHHGRRRHLRRTFHCSTGHPARRTNLGSFAAVAAVPICRSCLFPRNRSSRWYRAGTVRVSSAVHLRVTARFAPIVLLGQCRWRVLFDQVVESTYSSILW